MHGLAGIALFFAVGLVVSARLLGLWRKTRRLPELLAGLGLLGIGPLGFCLLMAGILLLGRSPAGEALRIAGLGLQALGFVASVTFTWRVFRPGAAWARALAIALCASLLATAVASVLAPARGGALLAHHHADTCLKILSLAWGAFEALRYWRVTRRRVALGLADPLICASFLCWGVSLASGAFGFVLIYAALLARVPGEPLGGGVQLVISLCGVVTAAGLYLAFLPPKRWAHWIGARAAAQAVAS
jgi:hypothetical protein